jgi:ppGpp synthetase/RelA/SpoT-type nucleotidyltranferase
MDSHSRAPAQADGGATPNQPLQAKISQMIRGFDSPDPKSAFINDIWPKLQNEYDTMRTGLEEFCTDTLKRQAIKCQVTSRTKTVDSIKLSLDRRESKKGKRFESLSDVLDEVHDLVGLRVVLDFPNDIERAIRFIKKSFREEKEPAIFRPDREVGRSWKTWFGAYQTQNYRLSIEKGEGGALSQFYHVMFEIQLTTIAESLYNRLAHSLFYKGSSGPLTGQDEIVMDLSHGISLCYALCLMYMKEKLGTSCAKRGDKDELMSATDVPDSLTVNEIVEDGSKFHENLTRNTYFDIPSQQSLTTAFEIPPEGYISIDHLKRWINKEIVYGLLIFNVCQEY